MPAVTPFIPSIIGGVGAIAGGLIGSRSAKKASQAQADSGREASAANIAAQREAQAFQQRQIDQSRADSEPWRQAGANALTQMTQRMQPGGDLMRDFGMPDFQKDPGYDFRMAEGMKGMTNSAAARGGLLSGAALKAASQYNQNFASNEFGNAVSRFNSNRDGQYNKLADLAGIGQRTANQNGQNAMTFGQNVGAGMMNTGQQVGSNMMGAGNARASGYLAQGNALTGVINQGLSSWNQHRNSGNGGAYGPGSFWDAPPPREGDRNFMGPTR